MMKRLIYGMIFLLAAVLATFAVYRYVDRPALLTSSAPTTDASGNSLPHIDMITPSSGPVGTTIDIIGENLAGFEGDLDAWMVTPSGATVYLPPTPRFYSSGEYLTAHQGEQTIRVTVAPKLCTKNVSYSDAACPVEINITPGTYTIYTSPWGTPSNTLTFTVTK